MEMMPAPLRLVWEIKSGILFSKIILSAFHGSPDIILWPQWQGGASSLASALSLLLVWHLLLPSAGLTFRCFLWLILGFCSWLSVPVLGISFLGSWVPFKCYCHDLIFFSPSFRGGTMSCHTWIELIARGWHLSASAVSLVLRQIEQISSEPMWL